ncbi:hypothetical protein GQ602_004039 [Ophiocordyceps camponoti-floridani]|uniref:Uncharacterized protein n=1 Tax=Ophiocordyceps camponoti-floridani TaxID=2030778 RepID=A0A8H4VD70_9HYPO|nr:hypothetical protein GQ602_004039 [Ophiocordyceps camponoti-floridani]
MRKLLLNSSEVSVLATLTTVILCTLALFLSGYAIQQRTLRDLRAAIRPHESPRAMTSSDSFPVVKAVKAKSWAADHPDPRMRVAVSRAERRRLIKAEMRRLALQAESKYRPRRRRLW